VSLKASGTVGMSALTLSSGVQEPEGQEGPMVFWIFDPPDFSERNIFWYTGQL